MSSFKVVSEISFKGDFSDPDLEQGIPGGGGGGD